MIYVLNSIFQLLNDGNTLYFNRLLAHSMGVHENIIYLSLLTKYYYYVSKKPDSVSDGWFYCTIADLQESTAFSGKQQTKAINNLVNMGVLETKLQGVPAKRYFKIVDDIVLIARLLEEGEKIARSIRSKAKKSPKRT